MGHYVTGAVRTLQGDEVSVSENEKHTGSLPSALQKRWSFP